MGFELTELNRTARSAAVSLGTAFFLFASVASLLAEKNGPAGPSRTITTVQQAHELPAGDADRAYPVRLHGVVTYFDPSSDVRHASMFLHDITGGIYVLVPDKTTWKGDPPLPGSEVIVDGITAPGDYASIIVQPRIRVLGHSALRLRAKRVSLTHLLTGVEDSQWVEVEGVVQSVVQNRKDVTLELALPDGVITAITMRQPGEDYTGLVDSKVLLQGNAAALFNRDRQMTGFRLMFPDLGSVKVEEAARRDPFTEPVQSINSLSRFDPNASLFHRVHLRGTVTLQVPGKRLCLQNDLQALCAESGDQTAMSAGDVVDVVGFAALNGYKPTLTHAVVRLDSHASRPVVTPLSVEDALSGNYEAKLIKLKGQLIGYDVTAKQPTLEMEADGVLFEVVLAGSDQTGDLKALESGSELSVTGICVVELDAEKTSGGDGSAVIKSFRILLRTPEDLAVLNTPSWWTAGHALTALAFASFAALAVMCWVLVLRRRVSHQTRMLRESEERFRHMAQHDSLTGLATRMLLHDRLQVALERVKRFNNCAAVLMLDLDNFKKINDSFGHQTGDLILRTTAERILKTVRLTDTAARIGGDEFVVLLTDLKNAGEAESVARKIMTALSCPIAVHGREIPVSASIGVCTVTESTYDPESLLKSVDAAMYQAKARGRNCFEVFTKDLADATTRRLQIQRSLGYALQEHELEIHYQSLVDFRGREVAGVEALLRWCNPGLGTVMPNDFIPIAEETGLIVGMGEWVLRQACDEIGKLEHQLGRSLLLTVNLSPRQLMHPGLVAAVEKALLESGRNAKDLALEITESTLMSDSTANRETLLSLRKLGVQLAIDDFGIGFSSLSYITQFAVQWIKIDRSLVKNCTSDRASRAVLRAIVAMAEGLGMRVVAEGIESEEQFVLLREEQCNLAQGFHLGRPMRLKDLQSKLSEEVKHTPGLGLDAGSPVDEKPTGLLSPARLSPTRDIRTQAGEQPGRCDCRQNLIPAPV